MSEKKPMTAAEAKAAMEAIDWNSILSKFPQAVALILQLIDLFKQRPVMGAVPGLAGDDHAHDCLAAMQKDLLSALAHNVHLLNCCAKGE